MKKIRHFILVIITPILLFCFAGCQATFSSFKPALGEEGEVFVYLQPFPQEAERLTFDLEEVSAVRQDGVEFPLSVSLKSFAAPALKRQRLLAAGVLPPGKYRGLSFKPVKALLHTDEGEASLLIPKDPVVSDLPFTIARKKATPLFLNFLYTQSVTSGFSFNPTLSLFRPGKPVTGLVGYVSNSGENTITIFDKKSGQVVSVLATGRGPKGVAFDRVRNRAYVALSEEDTVMAIDITTGETLNTIRLHAGAGPQDLALAPDGQTLISVNPGTNTVSFIDTLSYLELSRTSVGYSPASVLLNPSARNKAYVFNELSNTLSVIDIANRAVASSSPTDTGPFRGQFSRNGDLIYIIYKGSPYLTIMDPASRQTSNRIYIGMPAEALKVDVKTGLIYVAGTRRGEVEIYEPLSLVAVDFIAAESGASYLTIDDQENSLLLLSPGSRTLSSVNINTKNTVYTLDVGEDPYQVTLMGER